MATSKLTLKLFKEKYGVCRLKNDDELPTWCTLDNFVSITKTEDELSIVCKEDIIKTGVVCEKDWQMLKIIGPLDFSLIGILSSISSILASKKISIFAISTYDTDYILVKNDKIDEALEILLANNYTILD